MFKRIFFPILFLTGITISFLYLQSCDIKSPVENVNLVLNSDAPLTSISISFYDAKTEAAIEGDGTITATIEGPDKDKITDMGKNLKTSFPSGDGLISFGVKEGAVFPINITVVASANNYVLTSMPFVIDSKGGAYEVYMVNIDAPPLGVSVKTLSVGEAFNGVIRYEAISGTDLTNGAGGIAKIKLPVGTTLTDKSGALLNGPLLLQIAYFNPNLESSLKCFPGGFTYGDAVTSGSMVSTGFASIIITDQSNKVAKNFTGPLPEVTIEIPAGTNNFDAGRPIQLGDIVPILSYEPGNGLWQDESNGTVVQGSNSNFEIKFNISHLTFYNLDFKGPNCSGKIIRFLNNCNNMCLRVKFYRVASNGVETYAGGFQIPASTQEITVSRIPAGLLRMIITDISGNILFNGLVDICARDITDITLNTGGLNLATIEGSLVAYCPGNSVEIRPTIPIYFRKAGVGNYMLLGYMKDGRISKSCLQFGNYDFKSYYAGRTLYNLNVPIYSTFVNVVYNLPSCQ